MTRCFGFGDLPRRLSARGTPAKFSLRGGPDNRGRVVGANAHLIRGGQGLYQPSQPIGRARDDRSSDWARINPFATVFLFMSPSTLLFKVRPSAIHGLGLFAACALTAGELLGIYEGRRLSASEVEAVEGDSNLTYLFELSDGSIIDGAQDGNDLRHLNHSCQPNCEAIERQEDNGLLQLDIVALRAIAEGEELFIDYALAIDESQSPESYLCACLATACRGTMAGVD